MEVFQSAKNKASIWSSYTTLGNIPDSIAKCWVTCLSMVITALCTIARRWNQLRWWTEDENVEYMGNLVNCKEK